MNEGWSSKDDENGSCYGRTQIKGFTPLLDSLLENPDIGLAGASVFGAVLRFCWMERGVCDATHESIARRAGVTDRTVRNQLPKLVELGYIEDLTPGLRNKPHTYRDTGLAGIKFLAVGYDNSPVGNRFLPARKEIPSQTEIDSDEETSKIQVNKQPLTNFSNSEDEFEEENYFPPDYPDLMVGTEQTLIMTPDCEDFHEHPDSKPVNKGHALYRLGMALAEVCKMDFSANKGRLLKEARWLSDAENIQATPELVRLYFGENSWYYLNDWRGRKKELPRPDIVRQLWGRWEGVAEQNPPAELIASEHYTTKIGDTNITPEGYVERLEEDGLWHIYTEFGQVGANTIPVQESEIGQRSPGAPRTYYRRDAGVEIRR